MASNKTSEISRQRSAEIELEIREYSRQRDAITAQLVAIFEGRKAGMPEPKPSDDRTLQARTRALALLRGAEPPPLSPAPSYTREQQLFVEREAIDLVLKALQDQRAEARSDESVKSFEKQIDVYRACARDHILTVLKLHALEAWAVAKIDELEPGSVQLPFAAYMGTGVRVVYPNGDSLEMAIAAALAERIITPADVEEIKKHARP